MSPAEMERPAPAVSADDDHDGWRPSTDEPSGPGTGRAPAPSLMLCSWRQFHDRLRQAAIESAMNGTPLALLVAEMGALARGDDGSRRTLIQRLVDHLGASGSVLRYSETILITFVPDASVDQAIARAESFRIASATGDGQGRCPIDLLSASGYDPEEPLRQLLDRALKCLRAASRTTQGEA